MERIDRFAAMPHVGEPPLRAGMTATVSIDTGRQRSLTGVTQVPGGTKESPPSPPHDVTAQSK